MYLGNLGFSKSPLTTVGWPPRPVAVKKIVQKTVSKKVITKSPVFKKPAPKKSLRSVPDFSITDGAFIRTMPTTQSDPVSPASTPRDVQPPSDLVASDDVSDDSTAPPAPSKNWLLPALAAGASILLLMK